MDKRESWIKGRKHIVLTNLLIIIAIAFIGVVMAYMFTAIFTKHGEEKIVPKVENMSYTRAVELLHSQGFNVDIRDSLFRDDVKPGYVIEQFPRAKSIVKPGRKIFLYINAVHPKEVVMDDGADRTALALKGYSFRQAKSRLMELGFKNVRTVTVLGVDDRVVKILAHGKPVFQMQKVAVNAPVIIEVSDGRLWQIRDSLYNTEKIRTLENFDQGNYPEEAVPYYNDPGTLEETERNNSQGAEPSEAQPVEEPEYFTIEDE